MFSAFKVCAPVTLCWLLFDYVIKNVIFLVKLIWSFHLSNIQCIPAESLLKPSSVPAVMAECMSYPHMQMVLTLASSNTKSFWDALVSSCSLLRGSGRNPLWPLWTSTTHSLIAMTSCCHVIVFSVRMHFTCISLQFWWLFYWHGIALMNSL